MYFTTADNSKFIHLTAGLIGSFRTQLFIVTFPIAFESNAYSAPPCMRADVTFQLIWMNAVISRWSSWDSVIFYSSVLIITVLISFFFLCMFDSRRDNYSSCFQRYYHQRSVMMKVFLFQWLLLVQRCSLQSDSLIFFTPLIQYDILHVRSACFTAVQVVKSR